MKDFLEKAILLPITIIIGIFYLAVIVFVLFIHIIEITLKIIILFIKIIADCFKNNGTSN